MAPNPNFEHALYSSLWKDTYQVVSTPRPGVGRQVQYTPSFDKTKGTTAQEIVSGPLGRTGTLGSGV